MSQQLTPTKQPDKLLQAGFFSQADSEAISACFNEPDWLRAKRQTAWSIFEETPIEKRGFPFDNEL